MSSCSLVAKSCPPLNPILWIVAHKDPLSMGFPWQEYWSGLTFPTPGDLLDPGIEPVSPALGGGFFSLSHLGSLFYVLSRILKSNVNQFIREKRS